MSQASLILPTSGTLSGLSLVQLVNAALANLASLCSGATDPATLPSGVVAYSLWLDTSASPATLKMRNAANNGWATMGTISGSNFTPDLSASDIAAILGYTPVQPDGTGATGTWGISITGSAPQLATSAFSVLEQGGKLVIKYGSTVIASVANDGTITSVGNIVGGGTP